MSDARKIIRLVLLNFVLFLQWRCMCSQKYLVVQSECIVCVLFGGKQSVRVEGTMQWQSKETIAGNFTLMGVEY